MIITKAPLRIPLGGGGTDFPSYYLKHGGYILGFALNKYVTVFLHDTIDGKVRLKYSKVECVDDVDKLENRIAAEALKYYNVTKGVEVATFSDVPEGSGLGGSSAFCVALVTALRYKLGMNLDKHEILASAYDIERNKAGQPGGIQDQFFASMGGAWELELGKEFITKEVDVSNLLPKLCLVYTNTTRTDLKIAEAQEEATKEADNEVLSSLELTKELGRVVRAYIEVGELDKLGPTFDAHWKNKRRRSSLISNSHLDELYSKILARGATGGKLIGLGGGGYFLFYVPEGVVVFDTITVGLDTEGVKVVYSEKEN